MDTSTALSRATPVRNSTSRISTYRRRWACALWLDSRHVLLGGLRDDDIVRWERLDTHTGQRHRETAFGPTLAQDYDATEAHPFEPLHVSPEGKWLLGEHDVTRRTGVPGVLGPGGQQQKWQVGKGWSGQLGRWLPDGRSFIGFGFSEPPARNELLLFRIGQPHPTVLPLRGLPRPSDSANTFLLGTTPRHTALLCHYIYPENRRLTVYEVPIESGGRARRLGRLLAPEDLSLDWFLSPHGDRVACTASYDLESKKGVRQHAAGIWVCGTDGYGLRELGRTRWHVAEDNEALDYGLLGLAWHPDSRRVSFYHGNADRFQLFTARA